MPSSAPRGCRLLPPSLAQHVRAAPLSSRRCLHRVFCGGRAMGRAATGGGGERRGGGRARTHSLPGRYAPPPALLAWLVPFPVPRFLFSRLSRRLFFFFFSQNFSRSSNVSPSPRANFLRWACPRGKQAKRVVLKRVPHTIYTRRSVSTHVRAPLVDKADSGTYYEAGKNRAERVGAASIVGPSQQSPAPSPP